jgi:hypothetical protein
MKSTSSMPRIIGAHSLSEQWHRLNSLKYRNPTSSTPHEFRSTDTKTSQNRGGSPEWNATFAAYLNGSKSAWHEPMEVSLVAHISSRVGTVVVARGSFMPWEVPLKRAIRKWVDVKVERTPQVMNSKGGRVLLEMWRTRDKLPQHIAQSQASKDLAALPPWVIMQNSHTEARERRRQAEIDKLADDIFDPTMIQMGDGHVVPFEVLNMYENPNIFEPIVGLHKDPRFLSEHFGDFNRFVVRDIWTEKTEKGRWMVPNGEKIDKNNRKDDWYKWLRKFSGGKLTYDDCPPGSISPFLTSQQVMSLTEPHRFANPNMFPTTAILLPRIATPVPVHMHGD